MILRHLLSYSLFSFNLLKSESNHNVKYWSRTKSNAAWIFSYLKDGPTIVNESCSKNGVYSCTLPFCMKFNAATKYSLDFFCIGINHFGLLTTRQRQCIKMT